MAGHAVTRPGSDGPSVAFVVGMAGAVALLVGATMPQLEVPGVVSGPLFDPMAPVIDAGAMVPVFALFAVAFCLVGRYRWLMFCALMIVLFLAAALTHQLTGVLSLNLQQIVDMYNGVLPPDIDPEALLAKIPVLEGTGPGNGLVVVAAGLVLIELAPWLRRWRLPLPRRRSNDGPQEGETSATARREPRAVAASAPRTPDLLIDDLYLFADGLDQPLGFALLESTGRITRHRMRLQGAGYHGDTYFLRCRDMEVGNLRDVPAHLMDEIVDLHSDQPIDTDDMLNDLARVATEAVSGTFESDGGDAGERPAG